MSYIAMKEESQRMLDAVEQHERRQWEAQKAARKKSRKMAQINVRMTNELYEKLKDRARKNQAAMGEMARKLIEQGLKEE